MTIYQFNRSGGGLLKTKSSPYGYFLFTISLFLISVFHVLNIPSVLGFDFHFFLFEIGLLYLLLMQNYKIPFLTVLFFYSLLDFLDSSLIGQSFVSFLLSYGVVYFVAKYLKSSKGSFDAGYIAFPFLFLLFIILFSIFKLTILYFLKDVAISIQSLKYITKSIMCSFFICLNFSIIFSKLIK